MPHSLSDIASQLAGLQKLDEETLRQLWVEHYGCPAPRLSADMLLRAIAYRIQEKAYGGLKPATVRKLRKIAADIRAGREINSPAPTRSLRPGTQLMREWNGETHIVDALPQGFSWRGKTYPSLSAVARAITGARWSGPRFFGLANKPAPEGPDAGSASE